MAAVTAAAVAKKAAAALASRKKGRSFLGYVIGIAAFILCLPILVVFALFGWLSGSSEADWSDPIAQTIRESLPDEALTEIDSAWEYQINQ